MKHFSKMTATECQELQNVLQERAVQYFQEHGFSGLSHAGWFSIYTAIQDAIETEWKKAKNPIVYTEDEVVQ